MFALPAPASTGLALGRCYTSLQSRAPRGIRVKEGSLLGTLPMQKTLPKGHTSCLSSQFKYTSAAHTDVGKTFARIKQQLKRQSEEDRTNVCSLPKCSQMQSWSVPARTRGSA
jgi:hypothetical protein